MPLCINQFSTENTMQRGITLKSLWSSSHSQKKWCLLEIYCMQEWASDSPQEHQKKKSSSKPPNPPPFTYILFLDQHFECKSLKNSNSGPIWSLKIMHIKTKEIKSSCFFFLNTNATWSQGFKKAKKKISYRIWIQNYRVISKKLLIWANPPTPLLLSLSPNFINH